MKDDWHKKLLKRWSKEEDYELATPGMFELKHMMCMPDGKVYFMTLKESCEWLKGCKKPVLKERRGINLYALYDDAEVKKYNGQNYLLGPIVILSDLYPYYEKDLNVDEINYVLSWTHNMRMDAFMEEPEIDAFIFERKETCL